MRNAILPIAVAVAMFILGVFILNTQVWYTTRADGLAGARYVSNNMTVILNEAALLTGRRWVLPKKAVARKSNISLVL